MKRILSERNLVVIVFVSALVIFVFAQRDINKASQLYNPAVTVLPPTPPQEASSELKDPAQLPAAIIESRQ